MSLGFSTNIKALALITLTLITTCGVGAEEQLPVSVLINRIIEFGDWNKLQSLCDRLFQENPDDADALVARARLGSLTGKSTAALADCDRVISMHPDFAPAVHLRGSLLCDLGKRQAGLKDFQHYLALTQLANDAETHYWRGCTFDQLADLKASKNEYQLVINLTKDPTEPEDIYYRGLAQIRQNRFNDAVQSLTRLRLMYSVSPNLLSWLAYCHAETGDFVLALKECADVAEQTPECFANEGVWGWTLEKQKKSDEAMAHYEKALRLNKNYLFALRRRGKLYHEKEKIWFCVE